MSVKTMRVTHGIPNCPFRVLSTAALIMNAALLVVTQTGCSSPLKYEPRAQTANAAPEPAFFPVQSPDSYASCEQNYQVVAGDTLSQIADRCGVSLTLLSQINGIKRPDKIFIGQWLKIPLQPMASKKANHAQSRKDLVPSSFQGHESSANASHKIPKVWSWPTSLSTRYEWKKDSNGLSTLSVFGALGDEIYAVDDGVVAYAGNGIREFGQMIMLKHASGKLSVYAHNQALLVQVGQSVGRGDVIATMGDSGMSIRPMLHLEARHVGKKIPLKTLLKHP